MCEDNTWDCEDGYCPECLDICLEAKEQPVFATDASDVYLSVCPVCKYRVWFSEWATPEEQTTINQMDLRLYQWALNPGDMGSGHGWHIEPTQGHVETA